MVGRRDAIIAKARCDRAEHWQFFWRCIPGFAITLHLFGNITECVFRPFPVKLVDNHLVGEVEHIDFLELALGTKLRRHDIHGCINKRHNTRIALADTRCFNHDQIKVKLARGGYYFRQVGRNFSC